MAQTLKEKLILRSASLKSERTSWISHWKEISRFVLPRSGRYFLAGRNKGGSRVNKILDNTATRDLRMLGAGMMAGATSPARPWLKLSTSNPEKDARHENRLWLSFMERNFHLVFQKTNTYRSFHNTYEEMGGFGTSANLVLPDEDRLLHHYPVAIGEFCLATNHKGKVNAIYREFQLTVHEIIAQFGYSKCSRTVQNLFDRGNLDSWVTITHAIEPRIDRNSNYKDRLNMPFLSCYFENGSDNNLFLREGGYKVFPALCPRWKLEAGDIYGHSPGMECLWEVKQLQMRQHSKAKAIDYKISPSLQLPASLKNKDIDTLPGGRTYVPNPNDAIRPNWQVNIDTRDLNEDILDIRQRIHSSFYTDLFLILTSASDTRMTATEVAERHEEKLLMLGPVIERLQDELLAPLIDITFNIMEEEGLIPPPPPDLQGLDLTVEFTSILAQAQKAIGANTVDRFVTKIGEVAQVKPEVLDKFNHYDWVDDYADILGVNPVIVVPTDQAKAIAEQRAKAQEKQQQSEMLAQSASSAKDLSQAQTGDQDNLLNDVMDSAGSEGDGLDELGQL